MKNLFDIFLWTSYASKIFKFPKLIHLKKNGKCHFFEIYFLKKAFLKTFKEMVELDSIITYV